MCIGQPMQVQQVRGTVADCHDPLTPAIPSVPVDISLVDTPAPGSWLLVFAGAARHPLGADEARCQLDARRALISVMNGEQQTDHYFADLTNPDDRLPAHLANPHSREQQS